MKMPSAFELRELVFEHRPARHRRGVPGGAQRQIDGRDRIGERIAIRVDPLQRLLDPTEVAGSLIVEHAQADEIDARRDADVARAVGGRADDAGHVRAV